GRRAGTENLAALVGFGVACARAAAGLAESTPARVDALGERLLAELLRRVPETRLNGDLNRRVGGIVNLCFSGVDGEAVLHELDRAGVTVSTGSACSSGQQGPSHVLSAMGLSSEDAHASVRFSIGADTSADDIDYIAGVAPPVVERLRSLAGPAMERSA
ncbi:MAG TPA: aminotransferase class V-fold PLP-dependent enzyme, partial [Candidatus Acidoferrales bacterium]|nr:aminotransferase class V-fold PLP-dependent enzyme [Candidatus Acidoferrales bacterium]